MDLGDIDWPAGEILIPRNRLCRGHDPAGSVSAYGDFSSTACIYQATGDNRRQNRLLPKPLSWLSPAPKVSRRCR